MVQAGLMPVTLFFEKGSLKIIKGTHGKPKASVKGTMGALLGVVTGQGMVLPFLTGKIKISGNPLFLLKMLPLIQTD